MLFDSKGKLFGKVSIVDVIVVFVILLAIVAGYLRFSGTNTAVVSNNTEFYYTITAKNIRETNVKLLLESIGTQFRLGGKGNSSMGVLVDCESVDARASITKTDGSVVMATIPEKYDVTLTLKVVGNVNENGYFTPEAHEICAAKEYNITNIYCNITGFVNKVWTE